MVDSSRRLAEILTTIRLLEVQVQQVALKVATTVARIAMELVAKEWVPECLLLPL